jgi:hypothetical protein
MNQTAHPPQVETASEWIPKRQGGKGHFKKDKPHPAFFYGAEVKIVYIRPMIGLNNVDGDIIWA